MTSSVRAAVLTLADGFRNSLSALRLQRAWGLAILLSFCLNLQAKPIKMGVLLPLKENNNRSARMVEFYQGMLLAVDSLKQQGLSVDITTFNTGNTPSDMDTLLFRNDLSDMDIIFGPFYVSQIPVLGDYCHRHNIWLVNPFAAPANLVKGSPRHCQAFATQTISQEEAVWLTTTQFADYNFILVDARDKNAEGNSFTETLRSRLSQQGIYMRPMPLEADEMSMDQAMNSLKNNMVVLNSPDIKALNTLLPHLKEYKRAHPEVNINLLGYPDWQAYTNTLLTDFYYFGTYIYSPFYRNPLDRRSSDFERTFIRWFHRPMMSTYPRYAMMGFDLCYYFLRGLQLYGEKLDEKLQSIPARPFQNDFWFVRSEEGSGFQNHHTQLIHYAPDQTIQLLIRTKP